jgi:hypothetical protein
MLFSQAAYMYLLGTLFNKLMLDVCLLPCSLKRLYVRSHVLYLCIIINNAGHLPPTVRQICVVSALSPGRAAHAGELHEPQLAYRACYRIRLSALGTCSLR